MHKRKWRRRRQTQDVLPVSEYPETVEIARIHREARRFVGQHTLLQSFVDAQHPQAGRVVGNQGIPARVDQPPDLRTRHPQDGRISLHMCLQIQFRSRSTGIPPHAQPAAGAKLCLSIVSIDEEGYCSITAAVPAAATFPAMGSTAEAPKNLKPLQQGRSRGCSRGSFRSHNHFRHSSRGHNS